MALSAAGPPPVVAHGDEDHGDARHPVAAGASGGPRFEAATDTFELVGRLADDSLTLYVNRFATGEPVLQAHVELESGERKAVAAYRAPEGSYVVSEPTFVKALARPGTHPLVVTVTAGTDADLLEATLNIPARPADDERGEPASAAVKALAGTLGLGVLGAGVWAVRKRLSRKGERT